MPTMEEQYCVLRSKSTNVCGVRIENIQHRLWVRNLGLSRDFCRVRERSTQYCSHRGQWNRPAIRAGARAVSTILGRLPECGSRSFNRMHFFRSYQFFSLTPPASGRKERVLEPLLASSS